MLTVEIDEFSELFLCFSVRKSERDFAGLKGALLFVSGYLRYCICARLAKQESLTGFRCN